jgi:signal transduction histidine kinase
LGMWLYLCKKIIELHWWTIKAQSSNKLWGAKFKILIPKNINK